MTVYSFVSKTKEQGGWTGVSRFDLMLRRALPGLRSVTELPILYASDAVITDNHLSLKVPAGVKTIVVHHGCAMMHYERDPAWRTPHTTSIVTEQASMLGRDGFRYVAPSRWVAEAFRKCYGKLYRGPVTVIPHWVDPIPKRPKPKPKRIVGDWRDDNKGAKAWRRLAERFPEWEFRPLDFRTEPERWNQYGEASLYLCLSLSEGGSYSMCDAEAASLPIVTTDVGNCTEFGDALVISWKDRDNEEIVGEAIRRKLRIGREHASFYNDYTFESWSRKWREEIR